MTDVVKFSLIGAAVLAVAAVLAGMAWTASSELFGFLALLALSGGGAMVTVAISKARNP